jgi:hypothetical protein
MQMTGILIIWTLLHFITLIMKPINGALIYHRDLHVKVNPTFDWLFCVMTTNVKIIFLFFFFIKLAVKSIKNGFS